MISYQQPLLFSFEEWFKDTEWDDRLQAIRDPVPVGPALSALLRPARKARLSSHDPSEHIPTTKALRERLRRDPVLRWVGYRGPSDIPSAVTFSRLFDPRSQCTSLQAVHAQQVETGRERRIVSTVAAGSLFPLAALTTTATRHDVNMARPLVPITTDRNMGQQVAIFDAGYDQAMLYQDLHEQELIPIIPLNHHGVEAPESRDALGRPTCSVGYPLTLAGYDATTETQKFRCPHATGRVSQGHGLVCVLQLRLCTENRHCR
ncbi:MAG: hypothetical protein C7B47_11885 [Sulfobacillus thermosulfidooxidans]|uniref:Transposase IS4-like domain-containing protein n=1 Tax=Sulfobacillus thermosulfidooxidans TaxID=28034 RepID=A0A2T2WTQ1_SULTH|nr:MAG: hypothetical protein C7B47_11885 [Sulfobacillus thermosulfidooxidans]